MSNENPRQPSAEEIAKKIKEIQKDILNPEAPFKERVFRHDFSPKSRAEFDRWIQQRRNEQQEMLDKTRYIPEEAIPAILSETKDFRQLEYSLHQLKYQGWKGLQGSEQTFSPDDLLKIVESVPKIHQQLSEGIIQENQLDDMLATMGVTRTLGFRECIKRCVKAYGLIMTRK
ncbi:MAG: hypothetical protein A2719_01440 [Candidatus Ryanbacteria bacterium RIFCSPHIGHO2_01_FULL_45_22]|uniref:Uncharacterized protein n=2 Tax=Candidatus Ryaniibacteriota TaxID=1817914 RepID=A0A1G2G160_9BACT|nr:MAG: hypothetical protein A2719_01440 [Candidatus Ryanbacteria bacterium RIFCSPHIGHO2_01_FULL_45_22]OGZ46386.1 MAG: hypothetical protein A3J54_04325 [Candidatus Ryanbacteria bacterium RIFCSPHIGHO2_02_FULL_45_13b]